jgi:hypothetical protein
LATCNLFAAARVCACIFFAFCFQMKEKAPRLRRNGIAAVLCRSLRARQQTAGTYSFCRLCTNDDTRQSHINRNSAQDSSRGQEQMSSKGLRALLGFLEVCLTQRTTCASADIGSGLMKVCLCFFSLHIVSGYKYQ